MAELRMVRAHGADTLEKAKITVRRLLEDMKPTLDKYVDRVEWNADGTEARVGGKHVKGSFSVDAANLVIDLKLSFTAGLVRGKIESRIDEALRKNL